MQADIAQQGELVESLFCSKFSSEESRTLSEGQKDNAIPVEATKP